MSATSTLPGGLRSWEAVQADLWPAEGHRHVRSRAGRIDRPRVRVYASGQVDGEQAKGRPLPLLRRHVAEQGLECTADRPRAARPQHRVDDNVRRRQRRAKLRCPGRDDGCELRQHWRELRVAVRAITYEAHGDVSAPRPQPARRDQPVAAVVALADEHECMRAHDPTQDAPHAAGNLEAGILHQRVGADPGALGPLLEGTHLVRRDDLHWVGPLVALLRELPKGLPSPKRRLEF